MTGANSSMAEFPVTHFATRYRRTRFYRHDRACALAQTPKPQRRKRVHRPLHAQHRNFDVAYKKEAADLDDDESDYPAHKAGNEAYLRDAMPLLVGYDNIRDFIACTTYAMLMTDIISSDAKHYRANAKLALTAALRKPKPSTDEPRPVGRPPKSAPAAVGN